MESVAADFAENLLMQVLASLRACNGGFKPEECCQCFQGTAVSCSNGLCLVPFAQAGMHQQLLILS